MKKIAAALITLLICFGISQPASAHVLVMDETNSIGAILHIVPDDDPVAGETATLYFDIPAQLDRDETTISLNITNEAGEQTKLEVNRNDSLATASYIFPAQGLYHIRYSLVAERLTYRFLQTQRVARGTEASGMTAQTHSWAQALLVASAVGFVVTGIVAINRRRLIAKQSVL